MSGSVTLLDFIDELRHRLDDTGGNIERPEGMTDAYSYYWQFDDSLLLYKNRDLLRYLNETLLDFSARVPLNDAYPSPMCVIPVKIGQQHYTYDGAILTIESVRLASTERPLAKTTTNRLDNDFATQWRGKDASGQCYPNRYAENASRRRLTLDRTPIADDQLLLEVTRQLDACYKVDYLKPGLNTCIAALDPLYKEAIIQGVLMRANRFSDPECCDPQRAREAERQFNQLVGPPVSARQMEARRENANLVLHSRPYPYSRRVVSRRARRGCC